jgi:hypothetical protein
VQFPSTFQLIFLIQHQQTLSVRIGFWARSRLRLRKKEEEEPGQKVAESGSKIHRGYKQRSDKKEQESDV